MREGKNTTKALSIVIFALIFCIVILVYISVTDRKAETLRTRSALYQLTEAKEITEQPVWIYTGTFLDHYSNFESGTHRFSYSTDTFLDDIHKEVSLTALNADKLTPAKFRFVLRDDAYQRVERYITDGSSEKPCYDGLVKAVYIDNSITKPLISKNSEIALPRLPCFPWVCTY